MKPTRDEWLDLHDTLVRMSKYFPPGPQNEWGIALLRLKDACIYAAGICLLDEWRQR